MSDSLPDRAVILAAGRGHRMGSLTEQIPKPMLPVGGKPLLAHILERLSAAGVRRFCIVVGYLHEQIESYFGKSDLSIEFLRQDPVNGTGAAALLTRSFAGQAPFILTFGDILCASSEYRHCAEVLANHSASAAAVAVKEVDDPWQGAAVYELAGRITRIVEKPLKGTSITRWNSAGLYLFPPVIYQYLDRVQPSARGELELTSALDLMLSDRLELRISPIVGEWRDVGRPEDLAAVNGKPE